MERRTLAILGALGMLLAACENTTKVGSGCADGFCPQALARNDQACTSTAFRGAISISVPHDVADAQRLEGICVPEPLARRQDGTVNARMFFVLPVSGSEPTRCRDVPFLQPVSETVRALYAAESGTGEVCEVRQLAVTEEDGGDSTSAGAGFFYDDFSSDSDRDCKGGLSLRFTADARPWDGVTMHWQVVDTRTHEGEADEDLVCESHAGSEPVGTPCLPSKTSYDAQSVVIETRADACGDGVCMAFQLGGRTQDCEPGSPSTASCASPEEIALRAYCTCRCDAPAGSADACDCPDTFTCVPALPELDMASGSGGSYCVKNGTFTE